METVRLLFLPNVDAGNTNAQSLNVREIASRLDPDRIQSTLLYDHEPDARLLGHPGVRLVQLPGRHKTRRILVEMLSGYDVVAYMDYSPASYMFLHLPRALRRKTKTVFHAEAPVAQMTNPSRMLRLLYAGIIGRCDFYTGITPFVAKDMARSIGKEISYILPVGVDMKAFIPPAERANPAPVVLFAGTLIERKGPQHLIDAAAHFPEAKFRIVGAGRDGFQDVLRDRISRLKLNNVILDGPRTQLEILDIMRSSDIFVLPSRLEGIPKVTLEAAATGLPCVVFRDYETPSVKNGVTGYQVDTVEDMMQALETLIADPQCASVWEPRLVITSDPSTGM